MTTADTVAELLEPVVASLGVELVDVDFNGGVLRITVDQPEGISTDVLTSVNRTISPILDQHDPVPGRYTLEVSSPGVERKLTKIAHYQRAVGETVIAKREAGTDPRRIKGVLKEITGDVMHEAEVLIAATEFDGVDLPKTDQIRLAVNEIESARTVFNWGPTPKLGGKKNQQGKNPQGKKHPQQKHQQGKSKKTPKNKQPGKNKSGD